MSSCVGLNNFVTVHRLNGVFTWIFRKKEQKWNRCIELKSSSLNKFYGYALNIGILFVTLICYTAYYSNKLFTRPNFADIIFWLISMFSAVNLFFETRIFVVQSAGAVEYTDCFSAEE